MSTRTEQITTCDICGGEHRRQIEPPTVGMTRHVFAEVRVARSGYGQEVYHVCGAACLVELAREIQEGDNATLEKDV